MIRSLRLKRRNNGKPIDYKNHVVFLDGCKILVDVKLSTTSTNLFLASNDIIHVMPCRNSCCARMYIHYIF